MAGWTLLLRALFQTNSHFVMCPRHIASFVRKYSELFGFLFVRGSFISRDQYLTSKIRTEFQ